MKDNRGLLASAIRQTLPVWVAFLVAVLALATGMIVGSRIKSPAQVDSETRPPEAGLITAKVQQRQLTARLAVRADVAFADPVRVSPPAPMGAESAVVTGRVPKVGDQVNAGSVLLEVSGRPIFVLAGQFPAYRPLSPGSSGPDVQQMRDSLNTLGFDTGAPSQTYDQSLADAVRKLYETVGYPPPGSDDLRKSQAVREAQDGLTEAKDAQARAQHEYDAAKQQLSMARSGSTVNPDSKAPGSGDPGADLASLEQALASATRAVERAEQALADAQRATWPTVPSGEVVFATDLPRRVDKVNLTVGQLITGNGNDGQPAGITLSGADIAITAHVPVEQATLVVPGAIAVLTDSGGKGHTAKVTSGCAEPVTGVTCDARLNLDDPGAAERDTLVGNTKVTITVGTSSADGLVVPVAAVSAGGDGSAQVQLVTGPLLHNQPAAAQPTTMVKVEVGLSAEGYVEVRPVGGQLHPGDLVVVGVNNAGSEPGEERSPR